MLINSLCNDDDSDNNVMVVVTMVVITMVMMVRLQMKYSQPWPSCSTISTIQIESMRQGP